MRRQTVLGGALSAAASPVLRLDPTALPVRFTASDAAADGRKRSVEIDRTRVLLSRRVRGIAIRLNLPMRAYLGVSVQSVGDDSADTAIRLEHRDPALSVPLAAGPSSLVTLAEAKLWAEVLAVPLLPVEPDDDGPGNEHGKDSTPFQRRRRSSPLRGRRPTLPLRRRPGDARRMLLVHAADEIIARD